MLTRWRKVTKQWEASNVSCLTSVEQALVQLLRVLYKDDQTVKVKQKDEASGTVGRKTV